MMMCLFSERFIMLCEELFMTRETIFWCCLFIFWFCLFVWITWVLYLFVLNSRLVIRNNFYAFKIRRINNFLWIPCNSMWFYENIFSLFAAQNFQLNEAHTRNSFLVSFSKVWQLSVAFLVTRISVETVQNWRNSLGNITIKRQSEALFEYFYSFMLKY